MGSVGLPLAKLDHSANPTNTDACPVFDEVVQAQFVELAVA
jgi:hypothetical protein